MTEKEIYLTEDFPSEEWTGHYELNFYMPSKKQLNIALRFFRTHNFWPMTRDYIISFTAQTADFLKFLEETKTACGIEIATSLKVNDGEIYYYLDSLAMNSESGSVKFDELRIYRNEAGVTFAPFKLDPPDKVNELLFIPIKAEKLRGVTQEIEQIRRNRFKKFVSKASLDKMLTIAKLLIKNFLC